MPNIIKSFLVGYDPINKSNTFASGDYITGQNTLELSQECKIQSLFVKLKGKESQGKYAYLLSSFRGSHGKIVYRLEANLSHSVRKDSKAKLMVPLQTKMNLFTSGSVAMDVSIPKTAFLQGEDIKVMASVQNKSSRDIKLKYCLYRKNSYFANKKRKLETKDILKEEGEAIPQSVHLDVKYASDPEIKFPIIILPALEGSDKQQSSDYSASGFEASPNSDFPEGTSFLQNPAAPGVDGLPPSCETYDMYPSLNSSDRKS
uniref:Arrestin C-terminal-like domain-containing protein n=1 Tax=Astatotilapia calliptera TaxID=8154 RepID=A0AAX7UDT2_ASTCA